MSHLPGTDITSEQAHRLLDEIDRLIEPIVPLSDAEVAEIEAAYDGRPIDPVRDARRRKEFEEMRQEYFGDLDNPAWANGVVLEHKDAPEDEAEDDRILIESGILPMLVDAAMSEAPSGKPWQQELAEIDKPAISHADAAHTLERITEQIAGILGCCGRNQDLCEMDAQLIRHVWTNALRTVSDA